MDEDDFWRVISAAGGSAGKEGLHRLQEVLTNLAPEEILGFEDRLGEVLFRLDHRQIAKQPWRDVHEPRWPPRLPGISADGFLFARCAAVLEGRETVAAITADPSRFKRRWDTRAEGVLSVAATAWEAKTGSELNPDRTPPFDYETGSNPDGGWH